MTDDIFEGLPPPSTNAKKPLNDTELASDSSNTDVTNSSKRESSFALPPPPIKSALKRPKPSPEQLPEAAATEKCLRFKTTTDASLTQIIEAMKKIASHIKNPSKFAKASKLAIQLVQAGSVKPETSDQFFAILDAAMSSPTPCTDASVRADYHALFSSAQDTAEVLNTKQKNQLKIWTISAVVANDLFTDDSFLFSKTAGNIREAISDLPIATEEDDMEEALALQDQKEVAGEDDQTKQEMCVSASNENSKEEADPFGLDALIPSKGRKEEGRKGKKEAMTRIKKEEEEENKRFLKLQRKALITCLEIAAKRYKTPWCQTVIDILAKHAFDSVARFTSLQRKAIEKLWASIREQHVRRKHGKSISGKLDVTAFERLQEKYANEKISIRRAVGGSGDRRCQQWLG